MDNEVAPDVVARSTLFLFRGMFTWWSQRNERWSVAVKQGKDRVTFGIDPEDTKRYFADRNKSIKNANGSTKRIIHFVKEFQRSNGTVVKEHIRGLREFDWKGYNCIVNAPTFTSMTAAKFDILGKEIPGPITEGMVDIVGLGAMLARIEDEDKRKTA
jgi:hypothetical protein